MVGKDKSGRFIPGHSGFKPKGAISRINSELRNRISYFLHDNWEKVQADFDQLKPRERLEIYHKLLDHVLPKLQSIELNDQFDIKRFIRASDDERFEMLKDFLDET